MSVLPSSGWTAATPAAAAIAEMTTSAKLSPTKMSTGSGSALPMRSIASSTPRPRLPGPDLRVMTPAAALERHAEGRVHVPSADVVGIDVKVEAGKSEKSRAFSLTANDIDGSKKLVNTLDSLAKLPENEGNAELQSTITLMKKDVVNMELGKKDHWVEVFPENFAKSIVENQV